MCLPDTTLLNVKTYLRYNKYGEQRYTLCIDEKDFAKKCKVGYLE